MDKDVTQPTRYFLNSKLQCWHFKSLKRPDHISGCENVIASLGLDCF